MSSHPARFTLVLPSFHTCFTLVSPFFTLVSPLFLPTFPTCFTLVSHLFYPRFTLVLTSFQTHSILVITLFERTCSTIMLSSFEMISFLFHSVSFRMIFEDLFLIYFKFSYTRTITSQLIILHRRKWQPLLRLMEFIII